jgi:uncharacterized protein YggE
MSSPFRWPLGMLTAGLAAMILVVGCASSTPSLQSVADTPTPATVATSGGQPAPALGGTGRAVGVPAVAPAAAGVAASNPNVAAQPAIVPVATPGAVLPSGIQVTGTGQVSARPDEAIVSAGVQTRATTAQTAQSENNQTMQAVIAAIKGLKIPDKDVQTTGVALYPVTDDKGDVTGYNASNTVTVTVENVDQAGAVLDAAVRAGANNAGNVRFALKNQSGLRNQALAAAAADARSKADALAAALGLKITGVSSVVEGSTSAPIYRVPQVAAAAAAPSVPIEPGQLQVTADVTIVFSY